MGENGDTNGNGASKAWIEALRSDLATLRETAKPNWSALGVVSTVMLAFGGLIANGLMREDARNDSRISELEHAVADVRERLSTLEEKASESSERLDRVQQWATDEFRLLDERLQREMILLQNTASAESKATWDRIQRDLDRIDKRLDP